MNNGTSRSQGLAVGQALLILALLIWFWLAPIIATWLGQLLAEALDLASISGFSLIGITALWAPPLLGVLFFSRRRAGWRPVAATVAVLAIASGFALLDAIVKAVISEVTMLQAMLRLALLLPYTLFAMRFVPALVQEVSREHRFVGLERGNRTALWAALALAALATLPWPVTGALGDSLASAAILVQTLAGSVPVIFLVWGLAFTFLTSIYRRGWAAALVTLALYGGLMMARVLPSGNWDALGNAFAVLPLGLLLTELRARNGGLLALLALALPYSLLPQLFVDPRDIAMQGVPELQHILAYIVIWSFTGLSGIILWGVRQIVNYRARERIKPAFQWRTFTLLAAGACWVLWGGLYLLVGSPGFANDSFLIIMEEQTDLSFAQNASEREARIAAVREALIATAERTQAPIRSDLERRGLAYRPYYIINMIRVETNSPRLARQLESLPGVAEVIRNPNVREYLYRIPIPYGSDTEPA
ncbi:MAG: hypothetical protein JXB35_16205, partial [Anaerolineae bacterium]|nr:hypothetical protein [Anaerolineae bacterium]